jgi:hypothetical protein
LRPRYPVGHCIVVLRLATLRTPTLPGFRAAPADQVEVLPRPSSAQAAPRSTAARGADRDQSRHARRSV